MASGFWRAIRYHLGSIGFGAFIMASLRFILLLLALLIKSKRLTSKMRKVAKCFACLIGCIERMMNYVTDRAYIMIAVKGKNYLRSAQIGMKFKIVLFADSSSKSLPKDQYASIKSWAMIYVSLQSNLDQGQSVTENLVRIPKVSFATFSGYQVSICRFQTINPCTDFQ